METVWAKADVFEVEVPAGAEDLELIARGARSVPVIFGEMNVVPPSVQLRCEEARLSLFDKNAREFAAGDQPCTIEVPYPRLASVISIERTETPVDSRSRLALDATAIWLDCQNFGSLLIREKAVDKGGVAHWSARVPLNVRLQIKPQAFAALQKVNGQAQLVAWACTYSYKNLIPEVAKILSWEHRRAIP